MIIDLRGILDCDGCEDGPAVGGLPLIDHISRALGPHADKYNVTVTVRAGQGLGRNDRNLVELTGRMVAEPGSRGYSELTPGEPFTLRVGDSNLWGELTSLDGQHIEFLICETAGEATRLAALVSRQEETIARLRAELSRQRGRNPDGAHVPALLETIERLSRLA